MKFGQTITSAPALDEYGRFSWLLSVYQPHVPPQASPHAHVYDDGTILYHGPPAPLELRTMALALSEFYVVDRNHYGGTNARRQYETLTGLPR
jgi:hypothetical protein